MHQHSPCNLISFPTPATAPVGWFRALIERTHDIEVMRAAALEICDGVERALAISPSHCAELIPFPRQTAQADAASASVS
jgi:hypothetical protein